MTVDSWISAWSGSERIAFRFEGRAISYAELDDRIGVTAARLAEYGVSFGDRVAFCGLNRVEVFEALFACARLGAIFLPLNNRLSTAELRYQLDESDPKLVLTTDGFDASLRQAAHDHTVRDLEAEPFAGSATRGSGVGPSPDSPVLMVYTSGTTGHPKGALLSHDALLHTVLNGVDHQGLTADDRIIAPLPTFHVGGLNIQTLPTLFVGGEVVLMRRFDPARVLDLITEYRPTQTLLVPAMLSAVAGHLRFGETDFSCLVGINTGSSVVPEAVMRPYFERGVPVGQVYGATETGPTSIVLRYDEAADRMASCGRPALHTELRIVDRASGVDVHPGDDGELWLRGPNLFSSYWNDAEASREAFADGWYRTGDVGHQDAEGFVYISDRVKDVVISGGENIYPAEVENVLLEHPDIEELAVLGRPDERWGEMPVVVLVPVAGAEIDLEGLRRWCDGRLARYKQPREVVVVDALPRTALGKVQKHLLRRSLDSG